MNYAKATRTIRGVKVWLQPIYGADEARVRQPFGIFHIQDASRIYPNMSEAGYLNLIRTHEG